MAVTAPLDLSAAGARVLREAQNLCYDADIAIAGAEHILAAAILVLHRSGTPGLPDPDAVEAAVNARMGTGEAPLTHDVKYGSAARDAISAAASAARERGSATIGPRALALAAIASDGVSPAFFDALGLERGVLMAMLQRLDE